MGSRAGIQHQFFTEKLHDFSQVSAQGRSLGSGKWTFIYCIKESGDSEILLRFITEISLVWLVFLIKQERSSGEWTFILLIKESGDGKILPRFFTEISFVWLISSSSRRSRSQGTVESFPFRDSLEISFIG